MKLMILANGNFKLVLNSATSIEGDRHTICRYMWDDLDMEAEEIEFGIAEMERLNLNTAHFGVNLTFTHCSDSRLVQNVTSELKAIRSLREELHDVYKRDPKSIMKHDVGLRLLNLYIALNVDAVLEIIESKDDLHAA